MLGAGAVRAESPEGRWRVDWVDSRCTLVRQETGIRPLLFMLDMLPGSGALRVTIVDPAWSDFAAAEAAGMPVVLEPGGLVTGTARAIRNPAGNGVELWGIDESALAAFAAARSVGLGRDGGMALQIPLPGAEAAVRSLRGCADKALLSWGVDPAARAALSRFPKPAGGGPLSWFRAKDYPKSARRNRIAGNVVVRIAVDVAGRPAGCDVVESAGHAALDERTCRVIRERGRFEPALDSRGKPVASQQVFRAQWRLE